MKGIHFLQTAKASKEEKCGTYKLDMFPDLIQFNIFPFSF